MSKSLTVSGIKFSSTFNLPLIYIFLGLFFIAQRGILLWGEGSTSFFAYILFMAGIGYGLYYNHKQGTLPRRGPWPIYGSLLFLVVLSFAAIFYGKDGAGSGTLLFWVLLVMLGLTVFAHTKGELVLNVFPYLAAVFSSAVITDGLYNWATGSGVRAGGIIENVDTAALVLGLSFFFLRGKAEWLSPLILVAIFFTGCYWILPGLIFAYCYLQFERRIWEAVIPVLFAVLIVLALLTPYGKAVWQVEDIDRQIETTVNEAESSITAKEAQSSLHSRYLQYERVVKDFTVFGHGFNPSRTDEIKKGGDAYRSAHSTLFLLLNQLGVFAVLAWLVATFYVIWKSTSVRLGMLAILPAMLIGCNDFWLWNCLMPFYFVLLGVGAWDITKGKEKGVVSTI